LVSGCLADTTLIPIGDIFAVEFMADFMLLFLSFAVGLDPGKGPVGPDSCARPILRVTLGVLAFRTGFSSGIRRFFHESRQMYWCFCEKKVPGMGLDHAYGLLP
jgi:hypothetical protein